MTRGFGLWALFSLLAIGGCVSTPFEDLCRILPQSISNSAAQDPCVCAAAIEESPFSQFVAPKLDVLFIIGNTKGMVAKQRAFAEAIKPVHAALEATPLDYHLGVISTDVGSWVDKDTPWTLSTGTCDSYAGDDGRLQARSCLQRSDLSAEAARACAEVCPSRRFLPADGRPFIAREAGRSNVPLELAVNTGVPLGSGEGHALRCMLMLGDGGCAISSPLESAKRALDEHALENSGFLRADSVLVLVFLTDQDDCSVQSARRSENDPRTQSCVTPDPNAPSSCYQLGAYRCLARGLACDQPMNLAGEKRSCYERLDSHLQSIDSYVRFFTQLKPRSRIDVVSLWTQPALDRGGKLIVEQSPNIVGSAGLMLAQGASAGCQSASDPSYTGQAQVRLQTFLSALGLDAQTNELGQRVPIALPGICEPSRYQRELSEHLSWADSRCRIPCLPAVPRLRSNGSPECLVGYVPYETPQAAPDHFLPTCSPGCCESFATSKDPYQQKDPQIQRACEEEGEDCYCVVASTSGRCNGPDLSNYVFGIARKDNTDPPPGMTVSVRCRRECSASY